MSEQWPKCESMSIEEATISNMWVIVAIVEVPERKGLCPKCELIDIDHAVHCSLVYGRVFSAGY